MQKRVQHPASSNVLCCERAERPMILLGILLKGKPWPCVTALRALYGSYRIFHALSSEEPHSASPCIPSVPGSVLHSTGNLEKFSGALHETALRFTCRRPS